MRDCLPDYERLLEDVADELETDGQASLITFARAVEDGFDFNEMLESAQELVEFRAAQSSSL